MARTLTRPPTPASARSGDPATPSIAGQWSLSSTSNVAGVARTGTGSAARSYGSSLKISTWRDTSSKASLVGATRWTSASILVGRKGGKREEKRRKEVKKIALSLLALALASLKRKNQKQKKNSHQHFSSFPSSPNSIGVLTKKSAILAWAGLASRLASRCRPESHQWSWSSR